MTIQILVTLFSALIIGKALSKLKSREAHMYTVLAWIIFWLFVVFLIWQPDLTNYLAAFLQVTRGADAVFYLSLIIIFYLFFKIFVTIEKIESDITTIVRNTALSEKKSLPPSDRTD